MPGVDPERKELITPYRYFGTCIDVVDGDTMAVESRDSRILSLGNYEMRSKNHFIKTKFLINPGVQHVYI